MLSVELEYGPQLLAQQIFLWPETETEKNHEMKLQHTAAVSSGVDSDIAHSVSGSQVHYQPGGAILFILSVRAAVVTQWG